MNRVASKPPDFRYDLFQSQSTVYDWRNKLFDEAPLTFGAEDLLNDEETEVPTPYEYLDPEEP